MAGRARMLRGQWMVPAAVLCGVAASILAFALSDGAVQHADELLLRQDTAQGALPVGTLYSRPPPAVDGLAALVGPGGVPNAAWWGQAGPIR